MPYKLVVDTETTSFINEHQPPEHQSQPHLVQLGLLLTTDTGVTVSSVDLIVRPDGYTIPDQAAKVHGVTTDIALAVGVPLMIAIAVYTNLRSRADQIIAHNAAFDRTVMDAAIWRTGRKPSSPGPEKWDCTMLMALPIMQLPPTEKMKKAGFTKFKPPNLMEAHEFFLKEKFDGAHSAVADCAACSRVYFAMKKLAVKQEDVPF